jgi:predicted DCC family thiol-disulfide oxidoreductase YuxK
MINIPKHKKLVLFDGVCNLCNASIQYIIKHDKKDTFRFAPLQSDIGASVLEEFEVDVVNTDSIILYSPDKGISIKSTAALNIARRLGFPRNLAIVFFIIPAFIRNIFYDHVARNRYKWYGRKEECMIPTPDLQDKFIS